MRTIYKPYKLDGTPVSAWGIIRAAQAVGYEGTSGMMLTYKAVELLRKCGHIITREPHNLQREDHNERYRQHEAKPS